MPNIAGVTTKKDFRGNITHVTISLKKHKEIILPVLEQLGVIKKSQFDIDFESGITVEEFRQAGHDFVKSLPWQK